jgi:hypothetical protein
MEEVKEAIDLVKSSIQFGFAGTEQIPARSEQWGPHVCYHFSADPNRSQPQFWARVTGSEPEEISITRKLMTMPSLDIASIFNGTPQVLAMLEKIEILKEQALQKSENPLTFFNDAVASLYQVEVEVYRLKVADIHRSGDLASDHMQAQFGYPDAVLKMNELGQYQRIATVTIPNHFDTEKNLKAVFDLGQHEINPGWDSGQNVKRERVNGLLGSIDSGSVFKLNGGVSFGCHVWIQSGSWIQG